MELDYETVPLMRYEAKKSLVSVIIAMSILGCAVLINLIMTGVLLSVSEASLLLTQTLSEDKNPTQDVLPEIFSVTVHSAVRNQGNRGTCWAFATMRFVEDRYASQGVSSGMLQEETYIRFSEQAYGKSVIDHCRANPSKCPDTPESEGNATDGYANWLVLFQDYLHNKLVVDMPSCKYTPRHGSDSNCGSYDEFIKTSSIDYFITDHSVLYDVDEIKRRIATTNRPMLLTVELYRETHFVPCDAELGYENMTECQAKRTLCPAKLQNEAYNRYCVVLDRLASINGKFEINNSQEIDAAAHVMLLVGYNKRGLILYNSWGTQLSHSRRYLTEEISNRDDAHLCTNIQDPRKWVPVDHDLNYFYKLRNTTILKFIAGGFQPGHLELGSMQTISEALAVLFNESFYYAVNKIEQSVDDTVRITFSVSESVKKALDGEFASTVVSPPLLIEAFSFFFEPQGITDQMKSSDDECGYYGMSYDYIDFVKAQDGAFFVDDINIKFTPESYPVNMQDGFAKKSATEAIHTWTEQPFKNQTPWEDDESWTPRWK